jgi:hypothetical protein
LRCLNYLLLITEHPVGSHVQPIYFWQTPQRTIVNIDAETYKHDLIKKVQPLESYIVPVTSLKPARITLQDALSDELRSEIVLQRSSSSPRLLASPSIIITLILTLIFLIANIMISLLDDNFAPDFTVASRTATGHNGLSLSPYVVAKIEHLPSLYNMTLAVTDDKFSLSTVHYISDVCNYSTSACYFSYLTGCRIGEAKNPGPHRAKSKSAATKSITRSDALHYTFSPHYTLPGKDRNLAQSFGALLRIMWSSPAASTQVLKSELERFFTCVGTCNGGCLFPSNPASQFDIFFSYPHKRRFYRPPHARCAGVVNVCSHSAPRRRQTTTGGSCWFHVVASRSHL